MGHRPVTRSQTQALQAAALKRDASRLSPPPLPKRRQRRRAKKRKAIVGGARDKRCFVDEDAAAIVDQDALDDAQRKSAGIASDKKREVEGDVRPEYEVLIWGDGSMGQLGTEAGDEDPQVLLPVVLPLSQRVAEISAGGMHTLMLMADGSLQSFGSNDEGALGRKTVGDVWDVDAADDPTMQQFRPAPVELTDVRSSVKGIRCTDSGSFFWTEDGRIFGWGAFRSSSGLIGFAEHVDIQKLPTCVYSPSHTNKHTTKLATGSHHVLALLEVGFIDWTDTRECLKDGSVLSWGDGEKGQLGRCHPERDDKDVMLQPTAISRLEKVRIVDVFCGEAASFFKVSTGQIHACGLNSAGQLGIAPSAASAQETCPTVDSSVQGKALLLYPEEVESISKLEVEVKQLSSGKRHTLLLTEGGVVYSFGAPMYGVLGRLREEAEIFSNELYPSPQKLPVLKGQTIQDIAAGQDCSACLDEEGRLWRFGGEHSGLICVGTDGDDIFLPQLLKKGQATKQFDFRHIAFGGQHGVILGRRRSEKV